MSYLQDHQNVNIRCLDAILDDIFHPSCCLKQDGLTFTYHYVMQRPRLITSVFYYLFMPYPQGGVEFPHQKLLMLLLAHYVWAIPRTVHLNANLDNEIK